MRSKKYTTLAGFRVKALSLALASSFLIYSGTHAAGLGKLTVLSSLGQPLRAEIELTSVTSNDVDNLFPKLADAEAFRQANVDFNPVLSSLRFAVEERGSRHFVLITSSQSFNEPYVELLVELTSGSGRLVREYPMLLDLVEMTAANGGDTVSAVGKADRISAPQNMPSAALVSPIDQKIKQKIKPPPDKSINAGSKQDSSPNSARSSGAYYQIKRGDTLGKIAEQFKYSGVSLDQMLVALQRNNPAAVINDNMNLIRSGVILTIPDKSEVERIDQSAAQKMVIAQSADFNAYREKLAHQVAQGDSEKTTESKKINSGKITAKVIEPPTVLNEAKDKLKLSKPQLPAQVSTQAEIKQTEEDKIAAKKARDMSAARIKELEQNTAKLEKILELQNEAALVSASSPANNVDNKADVVNRDTTSAVAPTIKPAIAAEQKVTPSPITVTAKPEPAAQQRFFDNWERFVSYGALVIALLVGLGMYLSKRKKKIEHTDDASMPAESGKKEVSLSTDIETDNDVASSDSVWSATQIIENEVDPVTEADIHIAYGRDEQAEEILKLALCAQPDSPSIRIKLLQIYARRTDITKFREIAGELHKLTGGAGPEWEQAAAMGIILDPQNLLYAGEQSVNDDAPSPVAITVTRPENDVVSVHSDSEPCPECEKTGMTISPLNFNVSASTAKQEELIQVETSSLTQRDNTGLSRSAPSDSDAADAVIPAHTPVEFDLSGIDLELPERSGAETQLNTGQESNVAREVAIKLDLAITYQKIGDKDGARELLDEVLQNGNEEQVVRAKALLQELS